MGTILDHLKPWAIVIAFVLIWGLAGGLIGGA